MTTQNKNKRLTSVHVNIETHNKFKHLCVESQLTFQTLHPLHHRVRRGLGVGLKAGVWRDIG